MKIRKTNLLLVWMFTDDVPVSVWWENLRHKATHKAVWEQSPVLQVTFCVLWVTSSAISHVLCHKSRPVLSHVLCHKSRSVLWVTFCTTSHVLCHESRPVLWVTSCAMSHVPCHESRSVPWLTQPFNMHPLVCNPMTGLLTCHPLSNIRSLVTTERKKTAK